MKTDTSASARKKPSKKDTLESVNLEFHKRLEKLGYKLLKTHNPYPYFQASALISEYAHPVSKRKLTITASENWWSVKRGAKSCGGTLAKFFQMFHRKKS